MREWKTSSYFVLDLAVQNKSSNLNLGFAKMPNVEQGWGGGGGLCTLFLPMLKYSANPILKQGDMRSYKWTLDRCFVLTSKQARKKIAWFFAWMTTLRCFFFFLGGGGGGEGAQCPLSYALNKNYIPKKAWIWFIILSWVYLRFSWLSWKMMIELDEKYKCTQIYWKLIIQFIVVHEKCM